MTESIQTTVGQTLSITLQSMVGSTGYGWYLSKLNGGLALASANIQATAPGIAPVIHTFNFLAVEEGTFNLSFNLIAPWMPGEPADIKNYEVTVNNA